MGLEKSGTSRRSIAMTKLTTERVHDLKIYPEFFSAVCTGIKRAELRKNDRDYRVGDVLHLCEFSKTTGRTGEYIDVIVTHIADVSDWLSGYVLLSIKPQENDAAPVLPKRPAIPEQTEREKRVLKLIHDNNLSWEILWNKLEEAHCIIDKLLESKSAQESE